MMEPSAIGSTSKVVPPGGGGTAAVGSSDTLRSGAPLGTNCWRSGGAAGGALAGASGCALEAAEVEAASGGSLGACGGEVGVAATKASKVMAVTAGPMCILRAVPSSEALTRGVRVVVNARYSSSHSDPAKREWFFLYTVTITNEGKETVQLVNRHWVIMNANGHVEEVRGPGVVGNQPTLKTGESFEYTSGCPLKTPFGSMHGEYEMVTEAGDMFLAEIAPFALRESETFH